MKAPYFFLLAIALMFFTGCENKNNVAKQGDKIAEQQDTDQLPSPQVNCVIGTSFDSAANQNALKINGNKIYVDIKLTTGDSGFIYGGKHMVIEEGGYKALAFMYHKEGTTMQQRQVPDLGNIPTLTDIKFNFDKPASWGENDSIRVIALNETDSAIFDSLKGYFTLKLLMFKDKQACQKDYDALNDMWNYYNPHNPVITKGNQPQYEHFIPRVTKDDGVLSLKK
ncbi:hypothetical protein AM493_11230 [Flavobacterium akiainvivens]|uniref:Uncharacterized protein n=1 Tax=Flavobacterium akiainvivens TaxID=1202724 RepID=A0A0M9VIF2_9FLAO|nr:hypothetical protein [Flavobacterium akiainvivens]KOS06542.1 hypothetical protein AM493_11230 [Flavobacterium akiainvivens]SFQ10984.1 hypothetical protein SAMN05444144_101113 [Flavobacterium akiainvivens]